MKRSIGNHHIWKQSIIFLLCFYCICLIKQIQEKNTCMKRLYNINIYHHFLKSRIWNLYYEQNNQISLNRWLESLPHCSFVYRKQKFSYVPNSNINQLLQTRCRICPSNIFWAFPMHAKSTIFDVSIYLKCLEYSQL